MTTLPELAYWQNRDACEQAAEDVQRIRALEAENARLRDQLAAKTRRVILLTDLLREAEDNYARAPRE